ncbi:MAG: branched-chain amino acid ABC transporter permease [Actinobacteria bacterium]|jgi:branched-chain amino acid transport system permease protein|nr:branched-chain amino acid ABC transporter permease [Actinomycetota bacterium]
MNFSVLTSQFWSLAFQGLALGLIYSLVSLGYTMVYGVLRLINFANSEVFMVGTFSVLYLQVYILRIPIGDPALHGIKLIAYLALSLIGSMIVCALLAIVVELVAYRRLRARGANRLASLISAIGVSIALLEGFSMITGARGKIAPRLLDKWSFGEVAGANFRIDQVMAIVMPIIIFFLLDQFVTKSRLGKSIRAVSMSEENSKLMGIDINRVITLTFCIGGLTTGAAAFLYTTVYENTVFNVGFNMGIAAFTAAVLGGIGNLRGAFYGGLALGMLEQFASAVLGSQWKSITVFVVLVVILLVKPNGLFGEAVQQTRT